MAALTRIAGSWAPLPYKDWSDTLETVHMWTQVVGKVCLALTTLENHFWNIAFRPTPRGLSTPLLSCGERSLTIQFDFVDHRLEFRCSDGKYDYLDLQPQTVADFYRAVMAKLASMEIPVQIWTTPVEIPNPIPFEQDTVHRSYEPLRVEAFLQALLAMTPVFQDFKCEFMGKCSPVHFFWGSFDLAVTRFSGERAPFRPELDKMNQEAYSHAVISHGFWPGGEMLPEPVFYAYAAPEPEGFKTASTLPAEAYYHADFKEFFLPYEIVRSSPDPEQTLTTFMRSTYDKAADLAGWNRAALERDYSKN